MSDDLRSQIKKALVSFNFEKTDRVDETVTLLYNYFTDTSNPAFENYISKYPVMSIMNEVDKKAFIFVLAHSYVYSQG